MAEYDASTGRGGHSGFFLSQKPGSPGGSPRKKVREHCALPVTVKQLLQAQQRIPGEDEFTIDNREVQEVYIVGIISKFLASSTTSLNYLIEDGTGLIDVRIWLAEDPGNYINIQSEQWLEGAYVRVIGNLRVFKSKRTLVAFRLIRIEDFNEITYHPLECIYAHLYNLQGGPLASNVSRISGSQSPVKPNIYSNTTSSIKPNLDSPLKSQIMPLKPIINSPMKQQTPQALPKVQVPVKSSIPTNKSTYQPASSKTVFKNDPQLSPLQNSIMHIIREKADKVNGISLENLQKELKAELGVKEDKVRHEVDWLMELGQIFSTIDDQHFQVTDW
jgi:replication factor A2